MGKRRRPLRRIHCTVSPQTLWHLQQIAAVSGYKSLGRVIDKLVRDWCNDSRRIREIKK